MHGAWEPENPLPKALAPWVGGWGDIMSPGCDPEFKDVSEETLKNRSVSSLQ